MEIKIDIGLPNITDLCPYCFGTGKLKAMQSAMVYGGKPVRITDTKVKCVYCKGTGFIKT